MAVTAPPSRKSARRQQVENLALAPVDWLEERSGLVGGLRYFLFRHVPSDISWLQTLGSATLTAFIVQVSLGDTPEGSVVYNSIFAVGLLLFLLTFGLNLVANAVVRRFREAY